ncbi:HEPN domain-containing protein (plasmid) [Asticcacaulis sp. DW145]|uniref:HEPN domain-containing protein n=1 Tax=Asticcacaulis sp. DW145 TaxID=3095608 RepID=UPI003085A12B|nr:HEPN domain-containing protein [Asticcacaulis sp. DW145]
MLIANCGAFLMLADKLEHLPDVKRRELTRVVQILFDEFEDATKTALSDKRKAGRILKIILFGSYARGDWVEDRSSGYRSDYDLLIVVNGQAFTDLQDYWARADEHLIREYTVTEHIRTPVNFIVHSLAEVNDNLARGRPFFVDIARDGIMLYEAPGHPLVAPKPLTEAERLAEARGHYEQWFQSGSQFIEAVEFHKSRGHSNKAAFNLHQAAEAFYHCVLLTLSLYSPKSHRITMLSSQAEALDDRLRGIWLNDTKLHRQAFDRLRRAYVEARYSASYSIGEDELEWLSERVELLQKTVAAACQERLV